MKRSRNEKTEIETGTRKTEEQNNLFEAMKSWLLALGQLHLSYQYHMIMYSCDKTSTTAFSNGIINDLHGYVSRRFE